MSNIRTLIRKALLTLFLTAILPLALATACSGDPPTPAPTLQLIKTPTPTPEPAQLAAADTPPAATLTPAPTPAPTFQLIPTPTLTPVYSRHTTAEPRPAATSTNLPFTPVPQPTVRQVPPPPVVGIDTGKGTLFVEPELLALLSKHAAGKKDSSRQLRVILAWDDSTSATAEFVVSQGGVRETDTYDPDFPWADRSWHIPVESMLVIIQHSGVWSAQLWVDGQTERRQWPDHEYLNDTANLVLTAWHLGVPAENAAQYALFARGDSVLITMEATNRPDFESLIRWLEAEEVYILDRAKEPTMDGLGNVSSYSTVALTPVSVIAAAAQREDVVGISAERYRGQGLEMQRHYWPLEALWYEDTLVDEFVPENQKVGRPDLE